MDAAPRRLTADSPFYKLIEADMKRASAEMRTQLEREIFRVDSFYQYQRLSPLSRWEKWKYRFLAYYGGWRLAFAAVWAAVRGRDPHEDCRDDY